MRLLLLLLVSGCATLGGGGGEDEDVDIPDNYLLNPGRNESVPTVSYAPTAKENYEKGQKAFGEEDYLAAQRYFAYVRTKFPYSRFAALSDLRIADCQFARERFVESIDTYQNFVRLHPTHPKVPYARYKTGLGYYEQIPSDWFMLPPSEEKDQAAVRDAERALRDYTERFPTDENMKEASKVLAEVRSRLMEHERYAADFYKSIDKDRAYVGRLEIIRTQFADVGLDDELLLEIAEVYARLGEGEKLKSTVTEMEAKFPKSKLVSEAKELVAAKADG